MILMPLALAPVRDTMPDTWAARDGLGREVPLAPRPLRKDRFVAIFAFLWQENVPGRGLFDISKILETKPPAWGPLNAFHWWSEPRLGYYTMSDPYVIRRHAQMLTDAGVDAVVFDVTNGFTYDGNVRAVLSTYRKINAEGGRTPGIAFITHAGSHGVARHLYNTFYNDPANEAFWFRWKGKPLLLADLKDLPAEMGAAFTVRESWAWSDPRGWFGDGKDRWPWLDHTPQRFGWHEDPKRPEQVAVAAAQHPTTNIGRSFHDGRQPKEIHPERGLYFAEQWRRARAVDPELVFVTGWNEWIAQRFTSTTGQPFLGKPLAKDGTFFVDQYNAEYSRDIEPVRGGFGDAYYYQLVAEIRRFKGARAVGTSTARRRIDLNGGFVQWRSVGTVYRDDLFDPVSRDHPGWDGAGRYVDHSGRNDLDEARMTRSGTNLAVYIKTREPLITPSGSCWMTLRIGAGNVRLIVNRRREGNRAWIERDGRVVGKTPLQFAGRELHLLIPRHLFPAGPQAFRFQWLDNVPSLEDPMATLDGGDAAPNGRFEYVWHEPTK